jgi:hypothetical protein
MDEQGLTELHAFSSLVSQVKRAVEDIYWVYATACTAHDSKTRKYFLERFNKGFLDNAQKVVQMADAAQHVVVTSQEALADIKKWLNCQRMSTINLDPNLLLVLDRPCPVPMGDEERKYVTTMLGQTTAKSAPSLDLLQTLRVEDFLRTSTKLYLGKVVASYTHEVVWANMRIAGLDVLNPDHPTWEELVHDMPRTIIRLASNARTIHKLGQEDLSKSTCFDL